MNTQDIKDAAARELFSDNADHQKAINWIRHKEVTREYVNKFIDRCIELARKDAEWISVEKDLPDLFVHGMSKDVLTLAGSKMNVKCYDWELQKWSGSPHITVTHWMPLPLPPTNEREGKG